MNDFIFEDDEVFGDAETIIESITDDIRRGRVDIDEDERPIIDDLLNELSHFSGRVHCVYHPMGSWYIERMED